MEELSLHILDIAKNSVKANAKLITIKIDEDEKKNRLTIEIIDDGCGMSEEFLKTVKNPFSTTRTTRKVGMGISLFEAAAVQCGGGLEITSKLGEGTTLRADFELNSIDRAPLGDIAGTMTVLISGSPDIDFVYSHTKNDKEFRMNTKEIREILGNVPLDNPEVIGWIDGFINEGIEGLK